MVSGRPRSKSGWAIVASMFPKKMVNVESTTKTFLK